MEIKFMTYNLWAREDVAVYRRMQAVGDLVRQHKPDVIFFQAGRFMKFTPCVGRPVHRLMHCCCFPEIEQEVTHYILEIFGRLDILIKDYKFGKSRGLHAVGNQDCFCLLLSKHPLDQFDDLPGQFLRARIKPRDGAMPIHVTTTRLRSLARCNQRLSQAERYVSYLDREDNALLAGDMCWDDDVDVPFPLRHGWVDAWSHLKPQAELGSSWTYDGIWTEEIRAFNGFMAPLSSLKKRPDRFVCKLKDYTLKSIEVIGSDGVGFDTGKAAQVTPRVASICCRAATVVRGLVLTIVPNGPPRAVQAEPEHEGMIWLQKSEEGYSSDYYLLD